MKTTYWLYSLAILLLLSLLAAFGRWRREQSLRNKSLAASSTLKTCELLLHLLRDLQQHRGMSSAWLSGEAGFLPRLEAKQKDIAALLPKIQREARREGGNDRAGLTANQFSLFVFRWQCLLDELPDLSPEQNIARHNQSISRLLEWLSVLGELHLEPRVVALPAAAVAMIGVARNFTHRLPQLSECLGQARAIGSSVAARRTCLPASRVKLMFLIGRAESLLQQAVMAQPGQGHTLQCQHAIELMAHTVRTRLLLSTGVLVSSLEYFELSTRAIEDVFAWIALCEKQLGAALDGSEVAATPGLAAVADATS